MKIKAPILAGIMTMMVIPAYLIAVFVWLVKVSIEDIEDTITKDLANE